MSQEHEDFVGDLVRITELDQDPLYRHKMDMLWSPEGLPWAARDYSAKDGSFITRIAYKHAIRDEYDLSDGTN